MSMVRLVEEGAARSGDAADADLRLRYERRACAHARMHVGVRHNKPEYVFTCTS